MSQTTLKFKGFAFWNKEQTYLFPTGFGDKMKMLFDVVEPGDQPITKGVEANKMVEPRYGEKHTTIQMANEALGEDYTKATLERYKDNHVQGLSILGNMMEGMVFTLDGGAKIVENTAKKTGRIYYNVKGYLHFVPDKEAPQEEKTEADTTGVDTAWTHKTTADATSPVQEEAAGVKIF